jgi:NAD-dependent dihydropyrimidine dehydrogenase PreA subunit
MIEVVSLSRCTGCNICVTVCPTNVFDPVPGAAPVIARQADCQTCFMCEAYCPVDALYVGPDAEQVTDVREDWANGEGLLGSYRRVIGWSTDHRANRAADQTFRLLKEH